MILDALPISGILTLQSLVYICVFCRIGGLTVKIHQWAFFYLLELLRISLSEETPISLILIIGELYLLSRYYFKNEIYQLSFFYASYTFFFCFSSLSLLNFAWLEFLPNLLDEENTIVVTFILLLLITGGQGSLLNRLRLDLAFLREQRREPITKIINPANRWMIILIVLFILVYGAEITFDQQALPSVYPRLTFLSYILIVFFVLIQIKHRLHFHRHMIAQKEQESHLQKYLKQIEHTYQSIRGFRHDYKNLIISLEHSIRLGDIRQIQTLYQNVLLSTNQELNQGYHIDELINLDHAALKGIINWKINQAKQEGVKLELEIKERIKTLAISDLDLIRIISILLDNAIEAAKETAVPLVTLAIFKENSAAIICIKNSRQKRPIRMDRIFQTSFSSKGKNRGLGLYILRQIISQYQHVFLETAFSDYSFTQEIYIGDSKG